MSSADIATGTSSRRRAACWWVPWLIAGVLGFVVAVNGVLVYLAVKSAPGTVSTSPYEDGRDYNRVIARAAAQEALGWGVSTDVSWHAASGDARHGELVVALVDRSGTPVAGATLEARLVRPLGPPEEQRLTLSETSPGRYAAPISTQAGRWDVHVTVQRGDDRAVVARRIIAP